MANPQAENGHTDINHENMEALYKSELSGSEFRIILYLLRKSWGWHKPDFRMITGKIVTETKLSKKTVCESVNRLVTKRLLIIDKNGRDNTYRFNKDFEQWKVTERLLGSYRKVTTKLPKSNSDKVPKETNKERLKKDTNVSVKKAPNPELNELLDFATSKMFPLQGTTRGNRFSAWNLLKKFGLEKSKWLVLASVECRGKPYSPTISDFTALYKKVGDLVNYYQKNGGKNESRIGEI